METVEILRAARALIDSPEKWTKGAFGRNRFGEKLSCFSFGVVCYCASGAVFRVAHRAGIPSSAAHEALRRATGANHIPPWNDAPERTHAEVLEAFDKAIVLVS